MFIIIHSIDDICFEENKLLMVLNFITIQIWQLKPRTISFCLPLYVMRYICTIELIVFSTCISYFLYSWSIIAQFFLNVDFIISRCVTIDYKQFNSKLSCQILFSWLQLIDIIFKKKSVEIIISVFKKMLALHEKRVKKPRAEQFRLSYFCF